MTQALQAFQEAGVTRVIWLTLHESPQQAQLAGMNDVLRAIAAGDPALTLADWNATSQGHADWFQSDPDERRVQQQCHGARATAVLGIAPQPLGVRTSTVVAGLLHKPYTATLAATGGLAPYRWTCNPALPRGIHLLATGHLTGKPTGRPQRARLTFTVIDSAGTSASRGLVLRIRS